jgi:choline dehydrogenase
VFAPQKSIIASRAKNRQLDLQAAGGDKTRNKTVRGSQMERTQAFDYVIAGGGSAGCVLAARLSEDASLRVCLLEAGDADRHLWLKIPLKFRDFMTSLQFSWGYFSEPEPHLKNRKIYLPRGKVLGGSSSINGMIYCRCHPADFDHWRQLGLTGWSYADVLPYFRRSEGFPEGNSPYHGTGGPLTVSRGDHQSFAHRSYMEAGRAAGFPVTDDHNGAMQDGFGPADFTIRNGRRASVSQTFLREAMARPNLTVITGAHASRILFENRRAVGIEYMRAGKRESVRAEREVVISGGSYNSPQMLMLSGIGPADHLAQHGIDVLQDAPDVGRNLQEHVHVGLGYNSKAMESYAQEFRADRIAVNAMRWMLFKTGPMATLPVACVAYIRTRPELSAPDIELILNRINPESQIWFPGFRKAKGGFLGSRVVLLHPESRGNVTLRSNDPMDRPVILHNHLSAQNDVDTLRRALRRTREVYAAEPLRGLVQDELFPGAAVRGDAELEDYIRSTANILYHPTSTCRMGTDTRAVVDGELRVNGVEGLRVVDASVMPTVPGGHTNVPTIMIAEKAADMILGRNPLPAENLPALAAE